MNNQNDSPSLSKVHQLHRQQIPEIRGLSSLGEFSSGGKNKSVNDAEHFEQDTKKQIQNYIIQKTIGEGTFNKVKLAVHQPSQEMVAIKIIKKEAIKTQSDKQRLNKELKILRKVRHPNIAQLYEILEDNESLYLITEYCQKGQLFEHIIEAEKLTQFEASKLLQQLLDTVEYIHSLGICHRDLKPQNILLDDKYNLKLIDFGLSDIYSEGTKLKTACGSPCYAAPEMLQGEPYDGLKVDIWSVGIVLYAMCFGFLPFDNDNTAQLYKEITQGQYQVEPYASKQLTDLLSIILEVDPSQRATVDQIRQHPFCRFSPMNLVPGMIVGLSDIPYETEIQREMVEEIYSFPSRALSSSDQKQKQFFREFLKKSIKGNKHNEYTACYYLLLQRNLKRTNQTLIQYYVKLNNSINRYVIAERVREFYERRKAREMQQRELLKKEKVDKSSGKKAADCYQNSNQAKGSSGKKSHSKGNKKKVKQEVIVYAKTVEKAHPLQNQISQQHRTEAIYREDRKINKNLKSNGNKTTSHKNRTQNKSLHGKTLKIPKRRLNFEGVPLDSEITQTRGSKQIGKSKRKRVYSHSKKPHNDQVVEISPFDISGDKKRSVSVGKQYPQQKQSKNPKKKLFKDSNQAKREYLGKTKAKIGHKDPFTETK